MTPFPARRARWFQPLPWMIALALLFPLVAPAAPKEINPKAIRTTVEALAKEMQIPGVVVLVRTPQEPFQLAFGTAEFGGGRPIKMEDHARIGSITKTWTATVILQLAQEGKLRLDDPVAEFRPDVPNGANITIRQLLKMRSGLFNYSETLTLNQALDQEPQKVWKPEDLPALAFKNPPYFAPGKGYHYSNTNTILLGLIAEKLDGKPLAQVFRDRLFAPLGLKHTAFPEITEHLLPEPHPRSYMFGDNVSTMVNPAIPEAMQAAAKAGTLKPTEWTDANPSWAWAAGAGYSTAADLATWVEAMVGGKLLNAEMQRERLASPEPTDPTKAGEATYGLGIGKFGPLYGHTGELPGFNAFAGHDPEAKVTIVVWVNLAPAADGRGPAATIARALVGQLYSTP